ncbi:Gluconolactonase precursor [Planctomycetes bacterium Pan216]|uniref:Gluconolactonase n=1 Tax=Kolteria novifilia TaxID=2527975 RepID=A0A518B857_9BACT|nr:Gluconolactonase precursor [Planctomycetes bacterium Pan216]
MKHLPSITLIALSIVSSASMLQAGPPPGLVAPGGEVKKLADGFLFTEGPAADVQGNVYFTDIPNQRIHLWSTDGKLSTFTDQSGRANGLYFDKQGNLIACQGAAPGGKRRVAKYGSSADDVSIVDEYAGKRLNSPNDLWIDPKGGIYFTDPRYGDREDLQQDGEHVYYIAPGAKEVKRVVDDHVRPNGIVGTPDGKTLYITDNGGKKTYRYSINADGTLGDKKEFCPEGADGMTLDEKGNLYLTTKVVSIYNPAGKRIGEIVVPEHPANVTFGGPDGKTLFITARKGLYAIPMAVQGALQAGKAGS